LSAKSVNPQNGELVVNAKGSFAALRTSAAGSRFAHARKTPQLADSASSLYTTSFPIDLMFVLRQFDAPDKP
jgi:hypothetical protein